MWNSISANDLSIQRERSKQIESLFEHNTSLIRIITENEKFEIPFITPNGHHFVLRIDLTARFPDQAPVLRLLPVGRHAKVQADGSVLHEGLSTWHFQSQLGLVVRDVLKDFQMSSPLPITSTSTITPGVYVDAIKSAADRPVQFVPLSAKPTPAIVSILPMDLRDKTCAELDTMFKTDEQLDSYVEQSEAVRAVKEQIIQERGENERIARETLSLKPKMEALKSAILEKTKKIADIKEETLRVLNEHPTIFREYDPAFLLERLYERKEIYHKKSQEILAKFQKSTISPIEFATMFKENQIDYYLYAFQAEALSKHLGKS